MELISEIEKKKVADALANKMKSLACPMCANTQFMISDGYFMNGIQADPNSGTVLGGPTIPSIALICNNCGFISQHALGVIGMLDKK